MIVDQDKIFTYTPVVKKFSELQMVFEEDRVGGSMIEIKPKEGQKDWGKIMKMQAAKARMSTR